MKKILGALFVLVAVIITVTTTIENQKMNDDELFLVKSSMMDENEAIYCEITTSNGASSSCILCNYSNLYNTMTTGE